MTPMDINGHVPSVTVAVHTMCLQMALKMKLHTDTTNANVRWLLFDDAKTISKYGLRS